MKLTKNETTVLNDLGINPDWEEHPVTAAQTVRKILGNGLAGAKSVLRSLENKGLLETVEPGTEDEVVQFSEKGLEWITSNIDTDPDVEEEIEDTDEDVLDEATEEIEVDMDDDDDEEPESKSMVKQAAKKALKKAAKADSKKSPGATRTSHAGCEHESSKTARAKCRKERAKAAATKA